MHNKLKIMELKGIITKGERRSLTCCEHLEDVLINGKSLYDKLESLFNLDNETHWNGKGESPQYAVKYVILDEAPNKEVSFNDQVADTVSKMLEAEHISGCYSEWTCGYGGFDYVVGGHSIFKELSDSIGKYIHFKI